MAIQFMPGSRKGSDLGYALGGGAQQVIDSLMQQKLTGLMEQSKQKRYAQQIQPFISQVLGVPQEQTQQVANFLSVMDPSERKNFLSNPGALQALMSQPQQQQSPQMQGFPQQQEQQQQQQQPPQMQGFPQQQAQPNNRLQNLSELFKSPQQRMQEQTLDLKKQTLDMRKEVAGEKKFESRQMENKKDLQASLKTKEGAQNQIRALDNMLRLDKTKKLNGPLFTKAMETLGFNWMLSPESQEYAAESKALFKDLRETFGARPIGIEFEAFMKSIPTLQNSPEGRVAIAKNLKAFYEARSVKANVMMDILKNDVNISPMDLLMQTEERSSKEIDGIYDKLKGNLAASTPLPKGYKMFLDPETGKPRYYMEGA